MGLDQTLYLMTIENVNKLLELSAPFLINDEVLDENFGVLLDFLEKHGRFQGRWRKRRDIDQDICCRCGFSCLGVVYGGGISYGKSLKGAEGSIGIDESGSVEFSTYGDCNFKGFEAPEGFLFVYEYNF